MEILGRSVLLMTALLALSGNSILCRGALLEQHADPAVFTLVRILSGALVLWLLVAMQQVIQPRAGNGSREATVGVGRKLLAPFSLFIYFLGFSYAYLWLDTGIGALILFGMVQVTIAAVSVLQGHTIRPRQWLGMLMAILGLYFLVYTGVQESGWAGYVLMAVAGIGWGWYTLSGRGSLDPLRDTAFNFLACVPLMLMFVIGLLLSDSSYRLTSAGIALGILSGAITSGVGYTLWFHVVRRIDAMSAGIAQLTVPLIAAMGGVLLLGETLTWRMATGSLLILGGVLWALVPPRVSR